jgi:ACS family hexuronate transporter-like MFS transporter
MGILKLTGILLERTGSYTVLFLIAGSAYVVALTALHLLVPRLETAKL